MVKKSLYTCKIQLRNIYHHYPLCTPVLWNSEYAYVFVCHHRLSNCYYAGSSYIVAFRRCYISACYLIWYIHVRAGNIFAVFRIDIYWFQQPWTSLCTYAVVTNGTVCPGSWTLSLYSWYSVQNAFLGSLKRCKKRAHYTKWPLY